MQELPTAAARFIRLVRPTEHDTQRLRERMNLHPLDLEAVFTVDGKPRVERYADYLAVTLFWPRWDRRQHRFEAGQILWFISPDTLVLVDDGEFPAISEVAETLRTAQSDTRSPATPVDLLYEFFLPLLKSTGRDVAVQLAEATVEQRRGLIQNWQANQRTWQNFVALCHQSGWLVDQERASLYAFALSLGRHLEQTLQAGPDRPAAPARTPAATRLPKVVTSYAVAAMMMVLTVLWAAFNH